jgi:hypothetical protein
MGGIKSGNELNLITDFNATLELILRSRNKIRKWIECEI